MNFSFTRLNVKNILLMFLMFSSSVMWAQIDSLTTTLASGNGQDGVMFEISPQKNMFLKQFSTSMDAGSRDVEIYYKEGQRSSTASDWTRLDSVAGVQGCGDGCATLIPTVFDLFLTANDTYAFYITTVGGGMNYTNGDISQYSNSDVDIFNGIGRAYPFGTEFDPRMWNGTMYYQIITAENDAGIASLDSPTVFCSGNQNVYATVANFGTNQIDSVTVNWTVDGGSVNSLKLITLLDTANGSLKRDTSIFLGNYSFSGSTKRTFKIWTSDPNGVADTVNTNDTLSSSVGASLNGSYTIGGTSPDYNTISAAISDLNNLGVCGPVTFTLATGTYSEDLVINAATGASATNTITFRGAGDSSQTIIEHDGSARYATITLDGADFIRFEDLTIETTASTDGWGIHFTNGADNNIVSNCYIKTSTTATFDVIGIVFSGSPTSEFTTGQNGNDNIIQYTFLEGGEKNIHAEGDISTPNTGNRFWYNVMRSADDYCIYTDDQSDLEIIGNDMILNRSTFGDALYLLTPEDFKVEQNYIESPDWAVYILDGNFNGTGRSTFTNNIVFSGSDYGVYMNDIRDADVYNNTILGEPAILFDDYNGIDLRNNILLSTGDFAFECDQSTGFDFLDNNLYFTQGTDFIEYNNTTYSDLAAWQSAEPTFNQSSLEQQPNLLPNSLRINPNVRSPRGADVGLMVDIDGDTRCFSPTLGADESSFPEPNPTANFSSDSTYINSPQVFFNAASESDALFHSWYINGQFETNDLNLAYTFTTVQTDTITLITQSCGGSDTVTKFIDVVAPTSVPQAEFVASDNRVLQLVDVQLTDQSDNGPTSWSWEIKPQSNDPFDPNYFYTNGTSETDQNPEVTFLKGGSYEVCLTATNSVGSGQQLCKTQYIQVLETNSICIETSTTNAGGILTDDGGIDNDYSANSNCGYLIDPCADSIVMELQDFDLETNWDYLRIYDGMDNTGTPLWDVSQYGTDGITGNITDAGFDTLFVAYSGSAYVEFESDGSGQEAGFVLEWSSNPGTFTTPMADYDAPDTVCVDIPFTAENMSMGDWETATWRVDGEFLVSNTVDYTRTFTTTGNKELKLMVEGCGGIDSITKTIFVETPSAPTPGFSADNVRPDAGTDAVSFMDESFRCADSWEWTFTPNNVIFVNGTDANSQMPQVIFTDTGSYDVKLVAGNGTGNDSLTKQSYINVISYCVPVVGNLNSDVAIQRVRFGDIDNSSETGKDKYSDYTASESAVVQLSGTYNLIINRSTTNNNLNAKAWIDYNIDGDFDDPGELVFNEGPGNASQLRDQVVIPNNATIGVTRMRVAVSFGNQNNEPCGLNPIGEFEDYQIIISPDVTAPVITLNGMDTVYLEACSDLSSVDTSAMAMDNADGNITSQIVVTDNIDTATAGTYQIRYNVTDNAGNEAEEVIRTVIIEPDMTAPMIALSGNNPMMLDVDSMYMEPGVSYSDACSGLQSTSVINNLDSSVLGMYEIIYTALDNAGNADTVIRMIEVVDRIAPVISLIGKDTILVPVNTSFSDPGATVTDNYYNNVAVNVSGMVNTNVLGDYVLTYTAIDPSGNAAAAVERVVMVADTTAPEFGVASIDDVVLDVNTRLQDPAPVVFDNYYDRGQLTVTRSGSFYDSFSNGTATALGSYTVEYKVEDPSGNSSMLSYNVEVVDRIDPEIELVGRGTINIDRFGTYDDEGVTISDNFDQNPGLTTSGSYFDDYLVNQSWGSYEIVYTAEDQSGNTASVTRLVNVRTKTTGIDENESIRVKLYPNPARYSSNFELNIDKSQQVTISIVNMNGKTLETLFSGSIKSNQFNIDLSTYSAGVYFINVNTAEGISSHRLIVIE